MNNFFNDLFNALNHQDNHIVLMVIFLSIAAILVFLRIVAHIHFRGALLAFRRDARKDISSKDDFKKLKNPLLLRTVVEYKQIAEKAVSTVPAHQIVDRQVAAMSLIGWRYEGMLPFVIELERALLWIGLILAVIFTDYAFVYGMLAIAVFLIVRLASAFFDFTSARQQLRDEVLIYVEREVGRFYASDTGGAVLRLKNDLVEAVDTMTDSLEAIMANMANSLADTTAAIAKNMDETTTYIGDTMTEATQAVGPALAAAMDEKLINMNANLATTLESWEGALGEAVRLQDALNGTSDKLSQSSLKLQSSSELLAKHLQGHSGALSEQLVALVGAVDSVKQGVALLGTQQEALTKQSSYIERNQRALEETLAAYEASLQGLTQNLGDGLGAFINLHAQSSAQAVNDALKTNLDKIMLLARKES